MLYYKNLDEIKTDRPAVVTLGKFDGMHTGHQKLLKKVDQIAKQDDLCKVMFTFDTSPQIRIGQSEYKCIVTNTEKQLLAEKLGIDVLIECPFTDKLRNMTAEDFVQKILIGKIHAKAVVAGDDFKFGKNRQGDAEFLKKHSVKFGISVDIIPKEKDGERDISSTYIREELIKGNIEKVNKLLGFEYFILGEVVRGMHLGRSLGFPTINIIPSEDKLLPPNGVYASHTDIGGKTYASITNIGVKPTVEGKELGVETFILNFSGDLYGKKAAIRLQEFMRPEVKFASIEELKIQVDRDIKARREKL